MANVRRRLDAIQRHENTINQRGVVKSGDKNTKSPVAGWLLGLFIFVVVGSAVFERLSLLIQMKKSLSGTFRRFLRLAMTKDNEYQKDAYKKFEIIPNTKKFEPKLKVDERELKERLTTIQFNVTQHGDTEKAFSGEYVKLNEKGNYNCIVCDTELFESTDKFDSHCGWPSFSSAKGKIVYIEDNQYGRQRVEVRCGNCGGHLGHVFDDGIGKGKLRYCINSASINFIKK
ncbi:hypothetical protein SNEBB_006573 [Seison nebaliae]|nr:hypothetical protein SNEBB_006573 [Seison nebaliae]